MTSSNYCDIAFDEITLPSKPNYFLALPQSHGVVMRGSRNTAKQQAVSPEFAVSVDKLTQAFDRVIADEKRTTLECEKQETQTRAYIQRSALFHFPDVIIVKFVPLGNKRSTLIIFSHAIYGYYDFGVNKQRVEAWLAKLDVAITNLT